MLIQNVNCTEFVDIEPELKINKIFRKNKYIGLTKELAFSHPISKKGVFSFFQ